MKTFTRSILLVLAAAVIFITGLSVSPGKAEAKEKYIVIWELGESKLQGHKAYMASDYLGTTDWENIIGAGKKQVFTISKDCKYYLLDCTKAPMKNYRVSKKEFSGKLWTDKSKENGKIYYSGMACSLVIKGGKVVKVVQQYQP